MATHTAILLRKWARYGACPPDTGCEAAPGDPCIRKIPPHFKLGRMRPEILTKPHRGRRINHNRCGNDDRGQARIGDSFACILVPGHGGGNHRDWHGQTWPVGVAADV